MGLMAGLSTSTAASRLLGGDYPEAARLAARNRDGKTGKKTSLARHLFMQTSRGRLGAVLQMFSPSLHILFFKLKHFGLPGAFEAIFNQWNGSWRLKGLQYNSASAGRPGLNV